MCLKIICKSKATFFTYLYGWYSGPFIETSFGHTPHPDQVADKTCGDGLADRKGCLVPG